jgi:hypothetical protein
MTEAQKEKLRIVFDSLTEEQKNLSILNVPYTDTFAKILTNKEVIAVETSDTIKNPSIMIGYSGVVNALRVSKGALILKPNLIKELLN